MLIYLLNGQQRLLADVQAKFPGLYLKQIEGQVHCYAAALAQGQQGVAQVQFLRQNKIRYKDDEFERANWIRTFFQRVELGQCPIEALSIRQGETLLSYEVMLKNRSQVAQLYFPTSWCGGEEITGEANQLVVIQKLKDERLIALSVSKAGRVGETLRMTTSIQEMETWLQEQRFEQWICTSLYWSILGVYRQLPLHVFSPEHIKYR